MNQQFVFPQSDRVDFDKHGDLGKFFGAQNDLCNYLIVETKSDGGLDVSLIEHKCQFNYYALEGQGEFVINGTVHSFRPGDQIVVPPGVTFTYNGKVKLLLINTPTWTSDQEVELPKQAAYQQPGNREAA